MDWCMVLHDEIRSARKEHKCHECYRVIEKNELYYHEGTLFEGRKSTHKTCKHCYIARRILCDVSYDGFIYGCVAEDIACYAEEESYMARSPFTIIHSGMMKKWKNKRGKYWTRIWDGERTINVDKEMRALNALRTPRTLKAR